MPRPLRPPYSYEGDMSVYSPFARSLALVRLPAGRPPAQKYKSGVTSIRLALSMEHVAAAGWLPFLHLSLYLTYSVRASVYIRRNKSPAAYDVSTQNQAALE